MNDVLLFIMAVTAAVVQQRLPLLVCLLFGIHRAADPHLGDVMYYVSAGFADLMIVNLAYCSRHPNRLLVLWCGLAGITANLIGFGIWYAYLSPVIYDIIIFIIHLTLLVSFTKGSPNVLSRRGGNSARVRRHAD